MIAVCAPFHVLQIGRSDLMAHAMALTAELSVAEGDHRLRLPLSVSFIGEQGIDAGGLTREFFQLLSTHMLHPKFGMFTTCGAENEVGVFV